MARTATPAASRTPWSTWLWPACVFLVLAAATLFFWRMQRQTLAAEQQGNFEINAAQITVELRDRLNLHAQFLHTLGAYFATRRWVDAGEWRLFSDRLRQEVNLAGVHLFGFAPAVPGREGNLAVPVVYVAPDGDAANRSIGFDAYSEPVRRQAIALARDNDDTVISGPLTLVVDRDAPAPGFVMVHPIYRPGMPTGTVAERRVAFAGIVFTAYRMRELMQFVRWTLNDRSALGIADSDENGGDLLPLYDSRPDSPVTGIERTGEHEISFGHRTWRLQFRQHAEAAAPSVFDRPTQTLAAGLTISALLSLMFLVLATQRQRAEAYALRVTADLRQAEASIRGADRQKQAVLDAATEIAITATDIRGIITVFNRGAEKMLGYRAKDMVGRHTPEIFHLGTEIEAHARALAEGQEQALNGFEAVVALARSQGQEHRQWTYVRADGNHLRVDLVVTPQRNEDGEITGYVGVAVDITERERARAELEQHRDRLQELVLERTAELEAALLEARSAHQAKSDFLANMSHELRTPMHAILSFSGLGVDRSAGPGHERLRQYFERIRQSAGRLLDLINDLLDLSKLQAGRGEARFEDFDVVALVQRTITQLESLLMTRQLTVSLESAPGAAVVRGDEKQIERVVHNLLANAIKFSPSGGTIAFGIEGGDLAQGQHRIPAVVITCTDQGVGIPENELESIFEKFVQGSRTRTGAGGTGLGLAICREIVRTHHGTIRASNNADGGSCFEVRLPAGNPVDNTAD